jgi:hypothetical protein
VVVIAARDQCAESPMSPWKTAVADKDQLDFDAKFVKQIGFKHYVAPDRHFSGAFD